MYRKRNGALGFSFSRSTDSAAPNPVADSSSSVQTGLGALRKDMLYGHQIASTNFLHLDDRSFFVAGITDNERMSKNIYKALQKHAILDENGLVNTYKIGPKFINQLAVISTTRQKDLINMLFWWEEECHRFAKLKGEDEMFSGMIEDAERQTAEDDNDTTHREVIDHLKFAREMVRMKIRQMPTQRRQDTETDTDNIMDSLRVRASTAQRAVATSAQASTQRLDPDDTLPEYHLVIAK